MKRNAAYALFLLFVFLTGVAGHLLLRPTPPAEQPYTVTLKTDALPAMLAHGLPREGATLSLDGCQGTLLSCKAESTPLYFRHEGALHSRPSTLSFRLSFTLRLSAHEQNGRLYFGTRGVAVGENLRLSGQNFALFARILAFSPSF